MRQQTLTLSEEQSNLLQDLLNSNSFKLSGLQIKLITHIIRKKTYNITTSSYLNKLRNVWITHIINETTTVNT